MTREGTSELHLIKSALADGETAMHALERILDALEAARTHGQWDLFTAGFTTKSLKHARLDEAEDLGGDAQESLARFGRALGRLDAESALKSHFEIDRPSRLVDFLGNVSLTTWLAQKGIVDSIDQVNATANELSAILDGLNARRKALQA